MTTLTPAATMKRKRKRKLYRATMWGVFFEDGLTYVQTGNDMLVPSLHDTKREALRTDLDVRPVEVREIKRRSKR